MLQRRQDAMGMIPALATFFEFLQDSGQWSEASMPPEETGRVLTSLEFAVLEALDDPSRRSFSTNVLGYGVEHGLDPTDEEALAGYFEWYTALPHAERILLSDTGRLEEPEVPYDPETMRGMPNGPAFGGQGIDGPSDED
ncbi:hypothetical protein DEO23_00775 [Brachybacterium endophyticum]|uniref:Uncharacterized protein n=1 Tax=Brachybacterium endophyticum TaxID=2182385 RepID=A0A2U2RMW7_9MICO|nr:hypothetical protein DEO23_00775 [Brachybacterium endophyticum]